MSGTGRQSEWFAASLIAAGTTLAALVLGLGLLTLIDYGRPALALSAAVAVVSLAAMRRPQWLLPGLIGLVWLAVPQALYGGLPSPVEFGTAIAVGFTALRLAAGGTDLRGPLLFCGLVALAAFAAGLLSPTGVALPAEWLEPLLFIVILAALAPGHDAVRRIVIALVAAGLFLGLGAAFSVLVQPTGLFPVAEADPLQSVAPRAAGPFGEPNFFALSLAALVPLALYLTRRPGGMRWFALVSAVALMAGILATGSRGGLLAALAGGAMFALATRTARSAVLAGIVVLAALSVPFLAQAAGSEDRAVGARLNENRIAVEMWADRPLTGVGPANYPDNYRDYSRRFGEDPRYLREPHSLPLQVAAEQGLVGLLAWVGAGVLLVRWVRVRSVFTSALGKAVVSAIAAFAVGSLFLHGSQMRLLYVLVGLVFALGSTAVPWPAREGRGAT